MIGDFVPSQVHRSHRFEVFLASLLKEQLGRHSFLSDMERGSVPPMRFQRLLVELFIFHDRMLDVLGAAISCQSSRRLEALFSRHCVRALRTDVKKIEAEVRKLVPEFDSGSAIPLPAAQALHGHMLHLARTDALSYAACLTTYLHHGWQVERILEAASRRDTYRVFLGPLESMFRNMRVEEDPLRLLEDEGLSMEADRVRIERSLRLLIETFAAFFSELDGVDPSTGSVGRMELPWPSAGRSSPAGVP